MPSALVSSVLDVLGLPRRWPEPDLPLGVLQLAFAKRRRMSAVLAEDGCSVMSDDARGGVSPLVEAAIAATFLQRQMAPRLPMALVTDPSTRLFMQSYP